MDLTCTDVDDKSVAQSGDWKVIGKIKLTNTDKNKLISGEWLDDQHINAAQWLLHQQHPHISGFQSTTLQFTRTFEVQGDKEFVQIFNIMNSHWITVSTVGCSPEVVKVYDTMHLTLTTSVEKVIADLLHTKRKYITIEYANVQYQKGGSDCGPLAIAIATAICHGQNPEHLNIEQDKTREHLRTAFEQGVIVPFSAKPVKRKSCIRKERLKIYCSCRQIEDGRDMVKCDGCKEWFHVDCIQISQLALKDKNTPWFCQSSCSSMSIVSSSKTPGNEYTYERVAHEIRELKV